jgi:DNA invertase Pin-like site-specific DNA recombinase
MSTEPQTFSPENQLAFIRTFAEERGFEVIRIYEDAGRSGLTLEGRDAMRRLLDDVQEGRADFDAILVYDISRWGRFQDADEGGYYEHLCRRAGVAVHYCAEPFENDGSFGSTLYKSLKRLMAGEYSRELSVKVFAGQCRLIEKGFRQGGMAGYGLRRLLIDEHGATKAELRHGDRKSLQTDRVILVPGPETEVTIVRRIYALFVSGVPESTIAERLNHDGGLTDLGRPWTRGTVHQVLTNPKYVGDNVYNRISNKLKQRRTANAPALWIVAKGAFTPIVDAGVFERARAIVENRSRRYDDTELLALLTELLQAAGALSSLVIDEREDMPSSSVYRRRFGSLLRAYRLVGYAPDRDYLYLETNRRLRALHPEVLVSVVSGLERAGGTVERDPVSDLLTVNGEFTASIVIARHRSTIAGSARWRIRLDTGLVPDVTIAVRMDASNEAPLDYYVLPRIDMTEPRLRLADGNGLSLDGYRFDDLDFFFSLATRASFTEAA